MTTHMTGGAGEWKWCDGKEEASGPLRADLRPNAIGAGGINGVQTVCSLASNFSAQTPLLSLFQKIRECVGEIQLGIIVYLGYILKHGSFQTL